MAEQVVESKTEEVGDPIQIGIKTIVRRYFDQEPGFDSPTFDSLLEGPLAKIESVLSQLSVGGSRLLGVYAPARWNSWRSVSSEPITSRLDHLVRWSICKLWHHRSKLHVALKSRVKIEIAYLLGDYGTARTCLKDLERDHGVSLWALAMFFRMCESQHGTQFNRTELLSFTNEGKGKQKEWSNYLATIFSLRAELSVSDTDFNESLHFLDANPEEMGAYGINYLRYRLRNEWPKSDEAWHDIVHYDSRHSILDVFDTFVSMISSNEIRGFPSDATSRLLDLASDLQCDIFSAIVAQICSNKELSSRSGSFSRYQEIAEASFGGDFADSLELSIAEINEDPRFFFPYQTAALAAAHIGCIDELKSSVSGPSWLVLECVSDWFSASSDRIAAMEMLKRQSRFHSGTILGAGIRDFIQEQESEFDARNSSRVSVVSSPQPIPQFAINYSRCSDGVQFLESFFEEQDSNFLTASLRALLGESEGPNPDEEIPGTSRPRRLHVAAMISSRNDEHAIACVHLEKLRNEYPDYYAVQPDAQLLEASSLFAVDDIEGAALLTANLYAINPQSVPPKLLQMFGPLILDEERSFARDNIAWPIIATALRVANFPQLSVDRVHDFVSDYIESQDVQLPTELLADKTSDLARTEFVFLRDCCTDDIMESSIWIDSQESLLRERLSLCERIRAMMPDPPVGIEGEIGLLMRKLAVLDVTQRIERSRIYVDTDGIKERLPDSIDDTATRLLVTVAFHNKELNRSLKLLGMPNRDGGSVVLLSVDRGQELFKSIFDRIREQYLFSPELGLDANLSQSIRHGPIISGIRSIFDKTALITRKSSSGEYHENTQWQSSLNLSSVDTVFVSRAFTQLASSVDNFIQRVRSNEIQITSDATPDGLLNYEFDDEQVAMGFLRIEPYHEVDEIVDIAISLLVERTEANLQAVKHRITTDWEKELHGYVQNFLEQVERVVVDSKLASLRSACTDCCTEISRSLEKIAAWFAQEDKLENKSFTARSLVKTFEELARKGGQNCFAEIKGDATHADSQIAGIYFRSMWDLFFILFDNAIKHGDESRPVIEIEFETQESNTKIVVRNMVSTNDMEALAEKVEQLNAMSLDKKSDLSKLRSEGGSGIAKLHKIVRFEIGGDCIDYSISLTLVAEQKFEVVVYFAKGIMDENLPR